MAQTATASELGRRVNLLDRNIRLAREAHAEKLEAIRNIHDAAVLRLEVLKEELTPLFSGNPAARRFVDLALCTYGDERRFFSYRRTTHRGEADYGRLISAIVLE